MLEYIQKNIDFMLTRSKKELSSIENGIKLKKISQKAN